MYHGFYTYRGRKFPNGNFRTSVFCEVKTQIVGGTVVSRQAQYYYYTDFVRHLQDSGANTENSTEKTASLRQCVLILLEFWVVVHLFFIGFISRRQRFIFRSCGIFAVIADMVRNRNIALVLFAPGRGSRFGDLSGVPEHLYCYSANLRRAFSALYRLPFWLLFTIYATTSWLPTITSRRFARVIAV